MYTAHNKHQRKYKKSLLFVACLFLITTAVFTANTDFVPSNVFAQSASNPFLTTQTKPILQPTILGETNTQNTTTTQLSQTTPANLIVPQDSTDAPLVNPAEISLTAIPPRLGDDGTLKAKPGEKLQVQLRVSNTSEKPVVIATSAHDFILDSDGETPVTVEENTTNRWSLASWLTLTPTFQTVPAKATVGVNVLIEIPKDALPGGHYAMIVHEPNLQGTESNTNTAINQRVGSLLYVIVEGPINEEAYIRDFHFPSFSEYGPVPFSYTVENNSDVHIAPQMSVEIYTFFNKKVDTIAIETKNIFPLSSRDFSGNWERIWGWGLYKAKVTMSYGSSGSIVIANTSFWLLPIKIIIAAFTLILGFLLAILAIKRHLKHKKTTEEKRIAELEAQIEEMQSSNE